MTVPLFHALGVLSSACAVGWLVVEVRRSRGRWPLTSMRAGRMVVLFLVSTLLAVSPVPVMVPIAMSLPKSLGVFLAMLAYAAIIGLSLLMAFISRMQLRWAVGWIEPIDAASFTIELDGAAHTVKLEPGSVKAFFLRKEHYLQFLLRDGDATLHLVAPASIADLKLAADGVILDPPRGPIVASGRFAKLVRPYVVRPS